MTTTQGAVQLHSAIQEPPYGKRVALSRWQGIPSSRYGWITYPREGRANSLLAQSLREYWSFRSKLENQRIVKAWMVTP